MSTAITKSLAIDGWNLRVRDEDSEPMVLDTQLAERLGYKRPRKVRDLIVLLLREGKLKDIHVRPERGRTFVGVAERYVTEFWLTEAGALKVIAKSATKKADAILDQMIEVFIAARRGLLTPTKPVAPVLEAARCARIGGLPHMRSAAFRECWAAAKLAGITHQRLHGFIRANFGASGIYRMPCESFELVKGLLQAIGNGSLVIPRKKNVTKLQLVDKRQGELFPAGNTGNA